MRTAIESDFNNWIRVDFKVFPSTGQNKTNNATSKIKYCRNRIWNCRLTGEPSRLYGSTNHPRELLFNLPDHLISRSHSHCVVSLSFSLSLSPVPSRSSPPLFLLLSKTLLLHIKRFILSASFVLNQPPNLWQLFCIWRSRTIACRTFSWRFNHVWY